MRETTQFEEVFMTFREATEFFEQTMIERSGLNYELVEGIIDYTDYRWQVNLSFLRKL